MSIALQYRRGISAEILKYRKTFTMWLIILGPLLIPLIMTIVFMAKGDEIVHGSKLAWFVFASGQLQGGLQLLFPFYIIMLALLVNNIEWGSNTWKLIYTQPLSKATIYFSKVFVLCGMILVSLLLFATFIILGGYLVHIVHPDLGFGEGYNFFGLYQLIFKVFLAILGMAAIQNWLSLRSKNLILPLGVGIAAFISFGILANSWDYAIYHPYGYHGYAVGDVRNMWNMDVWSDMSAVLRSLVVAIFFFGLGYFQQRKRRIL
jgi:hypothetical protein